MIGKLTAHLVLLFAATMLVVQPVTAQSTATQTGITPVDTRNDLICFAIFAARGGSASTDQERTASTALIGHFHGRLRTILTVEQLQAQVQAMVADGTFERSQTTDLERCRTEALEVGNNMIAVGRAFVETTGQNGRRQR